MALLVLARRLRAAVRSLDDLGLLARVTLVMAAMPLLLRLPIPRALKWLDAASRGLSVREPDRAARIVKYCRGLGGLRVWTFQDNCVARSLALFTLLNRREAPLDVVFGVRATTEPDGRVTLGRRHVWLELAGEPLFETEPITGYVVSTRYREMDLATGTARNRLDAGEQRLAWAATGAGAVATLVIVLSGAAKSKLVAVMMGPTAIGLLGQQATLAVLLSYLASFGTSGGTSRFLSEALADGDARRAGDVVRTSIIVQVMACLVLAIVVAAFASSLASLAFGQPSAWRWMLWLLPAVPLTGLASVSASVLRGHRLAVRHSVAHAVAAIGTLAIVAPLTMRGDATVVMAFPALAAGAHALAMTLAAWPHLVAAWRAAPPQPSRSLARQLASYGTANVAMAACSAGVAVAVGRVMLTGGMGESAGRYYALTMGADVLLTLVLGGYHTHGFPTFCAAPDARSAGRVLGRLVRAATWFTVPVLAAVAVAAPVVVPLLLSERFVPIVPLVDVVVIGVYGRMLGAMFGIPFLARGHLAVVVALHAGWSIALIAVFLWFGMDGGAESWARAFAMASGVHACVVAAATHWWLRLRLDAHTVLVMIGGALLLVALAQ